MKIQKNDTFQIGEYFEKLRNATKNNVADTSP